MEDKLKIIIVEDEGIISEMLKLTLEDLGHTVVGTAHNKSKARSLIQRGGFNFAILDVNLEGGIEGIELAEECRVEKIPFMFLTSYADKYTLDKAKKTMPGAYVLKPFTEEDIYTGLEMSLMHSNKAEDSTVSIKDGHKAQLLDHEDILYIKADNIYIEVYTMDKKVVSRQTLSAALEKLPEDVFLRVHRSYAVNKRKIDSISRSSLKIGEVNIPISRSYKTEVRRILDIK
ncbi:MAG: response regulator transcription factor [Flavobacteriales bacterium]|jgi:two-component system, LytTR family, response regulator LytT|nr:response regulator transcription factor [Flavobacteriales bacterium]